MSLTEHYAEVRARLRNPPNAVKDEGIDLRRPPKEPPPLHVPTPRQEQAVASVVAQMRFDWNCQRYYADCFAPYVPPLPKVARPRIPVDTIIRTVASRYGCSALDICSSRRTAAIVYPRQIAMWLAKTLTLQSFPEIGRRFGGRDHTTILHGFKKIERLRQSNPDLQLELDQFVSALRPHSPENDNAEDPAAISG